MPTSDVRVWNGASWDSLKGPQGDPGPQAVSANAGNLLKLGTDNRVFFKGELPAGGTSGQVLTTNGSGQFSWSSQPKTMPSGQFTGRLLINDGGNMMDWLDTIGVWQQIFSSDVVDYDLYRLFIWSDPINYQGWPSEIASPEATIFYSGLPFPVFSAISFVGDPDAGRMPPKISASISAAQGTPVPPFSIGAMMANTSGFRLFTEKGPLAISDFSTIDTGQTNFVIEMTCCKNIGA